MNNKILFTKEKKQTLRERATQQMRQVILSGELKPGSRLIEQELSKMMGISRLPIREALTSLEKEGLVTVEPYKGAFVNCFSSEEVDEVYSVRDLLELNALELAMKSGNTVLVEELEKIISKMYDAKDNININFSHLDFEFHEVICKSAENKTLYKLWSSLAVRILAYINAEVLQRARQDNTLELMIKSHERLYEIISRGDFAIASQVLRDHLNAGRARLMK